MIKNIKRVTHICLLLGFIFLMNLFPGKQVQVGYAQSPNLTQATSTVLVMDVSGSMDEYWQGGVKLASAKQAANQIINMIEQDDAQGAFHRIGLVSFSEEAYKNLDLTTDYSWARDMVNNMQPLGKTNIYAGIDTGNAVLNQAQPADMKIMILLSDGLSNIGPSADEILAGPVAQAANQGTCIYTIGFGDPGELDENLLRQIASASGCGEYFYANDLYDLERIYIRIRHVSGAQLLGEFEGTIRQGETVEAGRIEVTPDIASLRYSLHWEGSKMDLRVIDPNGVELNPADSRVNIKEYSNLIYVIVDQPLPGQWVIKVVGTDVPNAGERFRVLASGVLSLATLFPTALPTPLPQPVVAPSGGGGFAVALVLLIVSVSILGLYIYQINLKKDLAGGAMGNSGLMGQNQKMNLMFISGPLSGQTFSYGFTSFSIGRGSANQLRIPDIAVSRLHATIFYQDGVWVLRDQNSRSGTYVNGFPVSSAVLKNGDTIMIGTSQISFRLQ